MRTLFVMALVACDPAPWSEVGHALSIDGHAVVEGDALVVTVVPESTTGSAVMEVRVLGRQARRAGDSWTARVPLDVVRTILEEPPMACPDPTGLTNASLDVEACPVVGDCVVGCIDVRLPDVGTALVGALAVDLVVVGGDAPAPADLPRDPVLALVEVRVSTDDPVDHGIDVALDIRGADGTPPASVTLERAESGSEGTVLVRPTDSAEPPLFVVTAASGTRRAVAAVPLVGPPQVIPAELRAAASGPGAGTCEHGGPVVFVTSESILASCRVDPSARLVGLQVCSPQLGDDLVIDGVGQGSVARVQGGMRPDRVELRVDAPPSALGVALTVSCEDIWGQRSAEARMPLLDAEVTPVGTLALAATTGFERDGRTLLPRSGGVVDLSLVATPASLAGSPVTWGPSSVVPDGTGLLVADGQSAVASATLAGQAHAPFLVTASVGGVTGTALIETVPPPQLSPVPPSLGPGARLHIAGVSPTSLLPWTCRSFVSHPGVVDPASSEVFETSSTVTFATLPDLLLAVSENLVGDASVELTCTDAAGQESSVSAHLEGLP